MIDLPGGLASWAPQLAVLPSDLALALAPWVGRIALAVGSLAASQSQRSGEPDGYSGLSRRGSYERLVTAEWGVADLFPDEFLRRAAAGEHLFLDLARSEPHGAMRSTTLKAVVPVVGVCLRDGVPGLLTRPHPYRLAWIIGDRRELLPTAAAPIAAAAVCPSQPNVAWVTEAGEVVVYSMQHHAVLFRRMPGASE